MLDVPSPLAIGGTRLYGVFDEDDVPKLARPVRLILASPSVGGCGCAESPSPSNASMPNRLCRRREGCEGNAGREPVGGDDDDEEANFEGSKASPKPEGLLSVGLLLGGERDE